MQPVKSSVRKAVALALSLAVAPALAQQALPIGPGPAGGGGAATPGGSSGAVQFNSAGTLSGLSLGTTSQVLIGNAAGAPTWGSVNLATMVTGVLPVTINAQTGTTYTVQASDQGKVVTFANASPVAVSLPQATGSFTTGFAWTAQNKGAGTVTITPTTSTINGAATLVLPANQSATIVSDGTNWQIAGTVFSNVNTATANTLNLTNGANAQTLFLTETDDGAGNYRRFQILTGGNQTVIGGVSGGSGGAEHLVLRAAGFGGKTILQNEIGTTAFSITSSAGGNYVQFENDNTWDIGASGATRPKDLYLAGRSYGSAEISTGAKPSLALAGGTCAGTVIAGGATAGTVTLTGSCASTNTMTLSVMPTAPTGYSCYASNRTTPANLVMQTSTTTTTSVFTFSGTASGATDVIQYHCIGY